MSDNKSRMEGRRKLKNDKRECHDSCDPGIFFEIKRSKVKVTKPTNAVTENQSYLRNGKVYELQTWYTMEYDDLHHPHAR